MSATTDTTAPVYGVQHLDAGWHRWAFTRNGVVLSVHRYRKSAVAAADLATDLLGLFGHEDAHTTYLLGHLARNGFPTGLATMDDEDAWIAGH